MKKWFMIVSAVTSLGMLAACGTAEETPAETGDETVAEERETLVMATSADYPPYESVDLQSGEIIGFDPDIANYIAEELGYELKIEDMSFDGLIPALQAGRADFVLSGMTPTEERKENVDFSDVYFVAENVIVTTEEKDISSMDELAGKKIGVQLGSIQETEAESLAEELGFDVVKLNRIPEIIQELLAGRIDGILMEDTVASGFLEAQDQLRSFVIPTDSEDEVGSAIAFPKGSELVEPFNEVLNEMIDSGKMDELILEWFDAAE